MSRPCDPGGTLILRLDGWVIVEPEAWWWTLTVWHTGDVNMYGIWYVVDHTDMDAVRYLDCVVCTRVTVCQGHVISIHARNGFRHSLIGITSCPCTMTIYGTSSSRRLCSCLVIRFGAVCAYAVAVSVISGPRDCNGCVSGHAEGIEGKPFPQSTVTAVYSILLACLPET
jgi:hypothetical protein